MLNEQLTILESDMNFQNDIINWNKDANVSTKLIINYIESNLPFHDSLNYHFGKSQYSLFAFTLDQAYQKMKNYGMDFIRNDSLKLELVWTYETNTNNLMSLVQKYNLYENTSVIPILNELFERLEYNSEEYFDTMTPLDYSSLKHHKTCINLLKNNIIFRKRFLLFLERRYNRMKNLKKFLMQEIDSRGS